MKKIIILTIGLSILLAVIGYGVAHVADKFNSEIIMGSGIFVCILSFYWVSPLIFLMPLIIGFLPFSAAIYFPLILVYFTLYGMFIARLIKYRKDWRAQKKRIMPYFAASLLIYAGVVLYVLLFFRFD